MKMMATPISCAEAHQVQDLRLDGHVERGGRLVGRMSSLGLHERAMAIITRWRMPPEISCGIASRRFRGRDADPGSISMARSPRLGGTYRDGDEAAPQLPSDR